MSTTGPSPLKLPGGTPEQTQARREALRREAEQKAKLEEEQRVADEARRAAELQEQEEQAQRAEAQRLAEEREEAKRAKERAQPKKRRSAVREFRVTAEMSDDDRRKLRAVCAMQEKKLPEFIGEAILEKLKHASLK